MITVILSYLLLGAKRFSDVGIYKAKFLLPYMSGAVLSNIISPIDFRNSLVLFVVNEKFRSAWLEIEPFLMDKKLNYKVMFIGSSNGQAHTVELGLIHLFNEGFNTNCPLFIFNGDTITHEKDFSYMISIFDNGDYSLHAEISPSISPKDGVALTITSRWQSASKPEEEQVRFKACLERGGLENLANLIQMELGK